MCVCLLIIEQIILYTRKCVYVCLYKITHWHFLSWFRLQDLREDLYYSFLNISYTVKSKVSHQNFDSETDILFRK